MPKNLINEKSTLVQVMAWCIKHQVITWINFDQDFQQQYSVKALSELTWLPEPFRWNLFRVGYKWTLVAQDSQHYINGLVQERRNSITNALELRLSCTNPSLWPHWSSVS